MRPRLRALRATAAARPTRLGPVRARRQNRWSRPAAAVRQAPVGVQWQTGAHSQQREPPQQGEHIGKPPGLPFPRTQPYLEFYLNHAKIDDESPGASFD